MSLTLEEMQKRETKLQTYYERVDEDENLYFLEPFVMKSLDEGKEPVPNVKNVTLNDPKTYGRKAIAALTKAEQRVVITGRKMKDEETSPIEDFCDNALISIDEFLTNMGESPLFPTQCERICLRGRIGARVGVRGGKNGTVVWDVIPWDMRYASYQPAPDGLAWASYKISKTKELIKSEHGITIEDDEAIVRDAYDREKEYIYINDEISKTMSHNLGYVPVVIAQSEGGTTLKNPDRAASEGESIYESVRSLYEDLNIVATVVQTMNIMAFKRPLQYESEDGTRAKLPKKPPYGVGSVTAVEKGGGFKTMPIDEVMNSTRMIWSILETRIQRGSFSAADYGNLTFPLSAVAIAKLTGEKDEIFLPRLSGLATFYQRLLRMIIKQFQVFKLKTQIETEGKVKLWTPAELKGNYEIKFKYDATSPEQNIANYSVAAAAGNIVSNRFKREEIIKLKNPSKMELEIDSEMADQLIPNLRLYKLAKAKFALGQTVEASIIANELGISLEQLKSGKLENLEGENMNTTEHDGEQLKTPRNTGKQLIPLLGSEGSNMPDTGRSPEKEAAQMSTQLGIGAQ